jgi:hypothetical protein
MAETTKQQLLRRAANLIGRDELAARLKIPESLLDAWISGHAALPDRKLVALADILDEVAGPKGS